MGCVCRKFELASACLFYRTRRLEADQDCSQKYREQQDGTGSNLQCDQVGLDMVSFSQTLANDVPFSIHACGLQSEISTLEMSFT